MGWSAIAGLARREPTTTVAARNAEILNTGTSPWVGVLKPRSQRRHGSLTGRAFCFQPSFFVEEYVWMSRPDKRPENAISVSDKATMHITGERRGCRLSNTFSVLTFGLVM